MLVAVLSTSSMAKNKLQTMKIEKTTAMEGAAVYQQNFKQFEYYIGSIGTVSIDAVALEEGVLTAVYSYQEGPTTRDVLSSLTLDDDGIYKGTCTTKVNGKELFSVNTWLSFSEDGTARGNWSWAGTPSTNDPIVKLSKK